MEQKFEDFDSNLAGEEGKSMETKTSWFKRLKKGITTPSSEKKEAPEGLWTKCPECNHICTVVDLRETFICLPEMQLPSPHWQRGILRYLFGEGEYTPNF